MSMRRPPVCLIVCLAVAVLSMTTSIARCAEGAAAANALNQTGAAKQLPHSTALIDDVNVHDQGGYWPCFGGPRGDNLSIETGLLASWPKEGPKQLWSYGELGEGYASVAIAGGRIYSAGDKGGREFVTALSLDGKWLWSTDVGAGFVADEYAGSRGTPTVDGDRVYILTPMGDLACLHAVTGKKLWDLNIVKQFHTRVIERGFAESLVVDGPRLYVSPFGPEVSIVALDKMDGKPIWQAASADGDLASYATPTVAQFGDVRLVVNMSFKALVGVNAETGELQFRQLHETKFDTIAMRPIYHDGRVFVSSGYRRGSQMVQLSHQGGKVAAAKAWENNDLDNQHDGCILLDGHIYGCSHQLSKEKLVCLDWNLGKTVWAEKCGGKSSLTYADGHVYLVNERADVSLATVSPAGLKIISEFKLPAGGEGTSWAHPVVCGGRLYVRRGNFLHVFEVAAN